MKLTPKQIIKRVDGSEAELGTQRTHWQELYDYIIPRKSVVVDKKTKGSKRGIQLYDNTAMVSCDILAGALHGMLTNPNQIWFELSSVNKEVNEIPRVKEYLQELTQRMHDILNRSNFQTEVHEVYLDLCSIGTAAMIIEEDDEKTVNFSTRFIDEIRIFENARGMIDEVHRIFKWDAKKIIEKFGEDIDITSREEVTDKFGSEVWASFNSGDNKKFEIIHSVYKENLHGKKEGRFPYISQYILKNTEKEIRESGFRVFPYLIPRWTKAPGEVYGRSPGMNALPEAKTLNLMAKTVIKGAQKTVDPPLQSPDDGMSNPKRTIPGSIHYYRAGSKDRIEPIYNDARIDFGFEAMRERQQQIRSAFFVDRLNLEQNDRMTQLEVSQRIEEQFRFLGPMLGRQQSEFLRPLIDRVLDIMIFNDVNGDLIGNPPPEIRGVDLDVVYTSPIARSQKIDQGQSMLKAWQSSASILEVFPEARDNIDPDEFVKNNWDIYGAPQKVLRDPAEVDEIRQERAQAQQQAIEQQQQAQQVENANKLAPLTKNIQQGG